MILCLLVFRIGAIAMTCTVGVCNSGGGLAADTVTAALQFFAATQCLIGEQWPKSASVAGKGKTSY